MELNFKQFGQGEPIIILHGLLGTLDNWQTIAKQLAKNYTVFIVDQRNHGKSPHDDAFDCEIMAEDLKEFMEAQWVYKAIIIGHSMGGKVAMQFALNYPDMVEQLVVVDIAPKAYEGGHQVIFDALNGVNLDTLTERKAIDEELKKLIPDNGVRLFLMKNLTRKKEGGYRWKMNLPIIYKNYENILVKIESEETMDEPTLFVRGGLSEYVKDEDMNDIAEYFPNAKLATVKKAGHWVHAAAPQEFLSILTDFLS